LSRCRRFVSRPPHYRPSNHLLITMPISLLFGEHVPDDDEQLARNRHNRFLLPEPSCKPLKLVFSAGMVLDSHLGVSTSFCAFCTLRARAA